LLVEKLKKVINLLAILLLDEPYGTELLQQALTLLREIVPLLGLEKGQDHRHVHLFGSVGKHKILINHQADLGLERLDEAIEAIKTVLIEGSKCILHEPRFFLLGAKRHLLFAPVS